MHSSTWKAFERDCAAFIGGKRYPANMGGKIDVEGPTCVGQVKKRTNLSHADLSKEVMKMDAIGRDKGKIGCVLHEIPRKAGCSKIRMITMSWATFDEWFSMNPLTKEVYDAMDAGDAVDLG